MAQKPMLRAEVYTRALRASQNRELIPVTSLAVAFVAPCHTPL